MLKFIVYTRFFQSVTAEQQPPPSHSPQPTSPVAEIPIQSGSLTPEQRAKLQSELDVVQGNMTVLGEMLYELKPGEEQPDELELLQVIVYFNKRISNYSLKLCQSWDYILNLKRQTSIEINLRKN